MILGLTGAIGSGKSTALTAFAEAGAVVFDADRMCHECYADPRSPLVTALAQRWGDIFDEAGMVDRRKIGAIVFRNDAELAFLTSHLYPELRRRLREVCDRMRQHPEQLTVIEIPLLFEEHFETMVDAVAALWCDPEIRHRRLLGRGLDEAEIQRRESRQMPAAAKWEAADYGLVNNGSPEFLKKQCRDLADQLQKD
ncbi:MAG: dephospho-CoA kinase [Lentisphaeria bacterium]|nr:dephospho-CoA kinase [Lentisphaeria bacterium]